MHTPAIRQNQYKLASAQRPSSYQPHFQAKNKYTISHWGAMLVGDLTKYPKVIQITDCNRLKIKVCLDPTKTIFDNL